ncbi:hypothetical protein ACFW1A_04145 [Kitasatospora sp. NPDC058965]|uniref:hypothetical protein n=1 Tax=Kitasatospora sp. NPDC058965 TaxID=3346682 RepID=UPI0036C44770
MEAGVEGVALDLQGAGTERHRRTVLHYDSGFDVIASPAGRPTAWVVPPGSADQ